MLLLLLPLLKPLLLEWGWQQRRQEEEEQRQEEQRLEARGRKRLVVLASSLGACSEEEGRRRRGGRRGRTRVQWPPLLRAGLRPLSACQEEEWWTRGRQLHLCESLQQGREGRRGQGLKRTHATLWIHPVLTLFPCPILPSEFAFLCSAASASGALERRDSGASSTSSAGGRKKSWISNLVSKKDKKGPVAGAAAQRRGAEGAPTSRPSPLVAGSLAVRAESSSSSEGAGPVAGRVLEGRAEQQGASSRPGPSSSGGQMAGRGQTSSGGQGQTPEPTSGPAGLSRGESEPVIEFSEPLGGSGQRYGPAEGGVGASGRREAAGAGAGGLRFTEPDAPLPASSAFSQPPAQRAAALAAGRQQQVSARNAKGGCGKAETHAHTASHARVRHPAAGAGGGRRQCDGNAPQCEEQEPPCSVIRRRRLFHGLDIQQ